MGEGTGDGDALLLTTGNLMWVAVRKFAHFDPAEPFRGSLACIWLVSEEQGQFHIFDGSECVKELERLKDESDFLTAQVGKLGVR